jgi:predicted NAD-dependent protein-ADP-ribosyltransferase YbiA (DUF1768 family)
MVKSLINSEIEYTENRGLYEDDKLHEAALYEIRMYDFNLLIAIGKPKNLFKKQGVTYYPIYAIKQNIVKKQIGVYELLTDDIPSTLDYEGDLDLIKLEPLLYNFIVLNPKQLSDLRQVDVEDGEQDGEEEKTQKDRSLVKKTKTVKLWVNKLTEDLNYDIENTNPDGNCFFQSLQLAFKTIGEVKSISEMREMLAGEANDELFEQYMTIFNDAKIEYEKMSKEAKDLSTRFKELKKKSSGERDRGSLKNNSQEAIMIKAKHDEMLETLYHTKELLNEFKYMENISNLEDLRSYIKTKEFWADTWSISTIERLLNIKIIILSLEAYRIKDNDNILECGQLNDDKIKETGSFQPNYYVILEYNGDHYNLITYDTKGALIFNEIPEYIKDLVVNKCLESNAGSYYLIPEFKDLKDKKAKANSKEDEEESIVKSISKEDKIQEELNQTMSYGHLFNENTQFVFYKNSADKLPGKNEKAGEKLDSEDKGKFGDLRKIKNWRKMLDESWTHQDENQETKPLFSLDSKKWTSVDHYVKGSRYKSNPDVYHMFSFESTRDLGKNIDMLQSVSKTGKYKKEIIIPKNIKPDENWLQKESENIKQAQQAKFSQNDYLKTMLLKTRNAKLIKHIHSHEPEVANELMQVRKILSE